MNDLVYILGKGSCWEDNELRFSLRSVEKFFKYNKIFIIGERPEWLTGVTFIDAEDTDSCKLVNARNKYLIGAKHPAISKDFILMNDDFFILKEVDEIKYYGRGKIAQQIKMHRTQNGYYFKSLVDTQSRLNEMGVDIVEDFEIHSPIIFNKEDLLSVIVTTGTKKPYLLRTAYGNLIGKKPTKVQDFKVGNMLELQKELKRDREFLSITGGIVVQKEFRDWIRAQYPEVSKFEDDGGLGANVEPGRPLAVRTYTATKDFMYGGKQFTRGAVIDIRTMKELKTIPKMREMWTLK